MTPFPRPKTPIPSLEPVIRAWELSAPLHETRDPADQGRINAVSEKLGRAFPPAFAALFEISDGLSLVRGNLMIDSLQPVGGSLSIETNSDQLREWRWPIPPELVMFGSGGSDGLFGIWLPTGRSSHHLAPIIEVGEIFKPRCMAIVGTGLIPFLTTRCSYYLIMFVQDGEVTPDCLDALGVPHEYRRRELDDSLFAELCKWSDPTIPDPEPDPYKRGLTADELRARYGADEE